MKLVSLAYIHIHSQIDLIDCQKAFQDISLHLVANCRASRNVLLKVERNDSSREIIFEGQDALKLGFRDSAFNPNKVIDDALGKSLPQQTLHRQKQDLGRRSQ